MTTSVEKEKKPKPEPVKKTPMKIDGKRIGKIVGLSVVAVAVIVVLLVVILTPRFNAEEVKIIEQVCNYARLRQYENLQGVAEQLPDKFDADDAMKYCPDAFYDPDSVVKTNQVGDEPTSSRRGTVGSGRSTSTKTFYSRDFALPFPKLAENGLFVKGSWSRKVNFFGSN